MIDKPIWWREDNCAENNVHVVIGKENYCLGADSLLSLDVCQEGSVATGFEIFQSNAEVTSTILLIMPTGA